MGEKPLITIYTQGYNAELYISECIESVLSQTYDNFEYFVVNHGSKDRTLEIINEYALKDSRIKVYDIPNSERGFMTDIMINDGRGEYVMTLDSDDYIHPECVEKLVSYGVRNNLDMVFCPAWRFQDGTEIFNPRLNLDNNLIYDINENEKFFPYVYDFMRTTWGKIIRMDVIKRADFLTFKENDKEIVVSDTAYTLGCYEKCKRIGGITDRLLYYRIIGTSVTAKYKPAVIKNNKNLLYQTLKILDNIGDKSSQSRSYVYETYFANLYMLMEQLRDGNMSDNEKINEIRNLVLSEDFKKIFEDFSKNETKLLRLNERLYGLISELFLELMEKVTDIAGREENIQCLKRLNEWISLIGQ